MIFNRQRVFHEFKDYVTRTQTSYDIVVNYRMDCFSHDKINYDLFTELHMPTIYIPEGHNHSPIGTCDQMAFGNLAVMEKYTVKNIITPFFKKGVIIFLTLVLI